MLSLIMAMIFIVAMLITMTMVACRCPAHKGHLSALLGLPEGVAHGRRSAATMTIMTMKKMMTVR